MAAPKRTLATRRAKIIFCVGGLIFSVLLLLWQFSGDLSGLFPSAARLDTLKRELKKARVAEEELLIRSAAATALRKQCDQRLSEAWDPAKNGDADIELRTRIEAAAKSIDFKLAHISTVRKSRINNELAFLEVDITAADADLATLLKLTAAIEAVTPKLYWRRFEMRPDSATGTGNLFFSGSLRLIGRETAAVAATAARTGTAQSAGADDDNSVPTPPPPPPGDTTPPPQQRGNAGEGR